MEFFSKPDRRVALKSQIIITKTKCIPSPEIEKYILNTLHKSRSNTKIAFENYFISSATKTNTHTYCLYNTSTVNLKSFKT
jgi:hypothetical protein